MIEFKRYKLDWPFSPKLNQFIIDNQYKYPYVINNELHTLVEITEFYKSKGVLGVSDIGCENTIFGNKNINLAFRAWHDSIHIKHNLPFTLEGELAVFNEIQSQLHCNYYFEKLLLYGDIIGQTLYYEKYKVFPDNQRDFVIDFLTKNLI